MQTKEYYGIHEILNDFERFFPYRRTKTVIWSVTGRQILVKCRYADHPLHDEEWPKEERMFDAHEGTQSVIIRIYAEYTGKNIIGMPCDPRLSFQADGIYINDYVMSDYAMARQFAEARKQWQESLEEGMPLRLGIRLCRKQLYEARKRTASSLKETHEKMERFFFDGRIPKRLPEKCEWMNLTYTMKLLMNAYSILFYELDDHGNLITERKDESDER